jgi:O-antigen/teichoic acid export membrane protein
VNEDIKSSIQKIGKGSLIALVGSGVGFGLVAVSRIIVARYGTESDYGVFSIALVIVNILVFAAILGMREGTTRNIAYHLAKGENDNAQQVISTSILFTVVAGILISLVLFLSAEFVATNFFHDQELALPLKVVAFSIPLLGLITIFSSIFRGFNRVQESVYFLDILRPLLFVILLVAVVLVNMSFVNVYYSFLLSLALVVVLFAVYARIKLPSGFVVKMGISPTSKDLLLFSLPLLAVSVIQLVMQYTDTLMLGYLESSNMVGLYNSAIPIVNFSLIPGGAILLIYSPILSGLFAKKLFNEINRNYVIITKWSLAAVLPLLLTFMLFPETWLAFTFGSNYVAASQALIILSIGWLLVSVMGPNGTTLMVLGHPKFLMWASASSLVLNIILNYFLIPQWGIIGASLATAISIGFHVIIRNIKLFSIIRVSPLTRRLLVPSILTAVVVVSISLIIRNFFDINIWILFILLILFYLIYLLMALVTKSIEQEDILVLDMFTNKIGVDTTRIKKKLQRFL